MSDCLFCKIAKHEIPTNVVYEDSEVIVFPDINPVSKYHVLIVPKEHIEDFAKLDNLQIWGKIATVVRLLVEKEGLAGKGYRLVVNGGGAQAIDHLHLHLIGKITREKAL